MALAVAAVLELLIRLGVAVPALGVVLLTVVAVSVMFGGIASGLVAAGITLLYAGYRYLDPSVPADNPGDLERMIFFAVSAPMLVLALGTMRHRLDASAAREHSLRVEADGERDRVTRILGSVTDGFVALDTEWRHVYVNPRAEELIGKPKEELLGRSMWEVFPEFLGTGVERELRRAVDGGVSCGFDYLSRSLGRWFAVRAYPSSEGLTIYLNEITDRKRTEAALRARVEQQAVVAEIGRMAFVPGAAGGLLEVAARRIAETLNVPNVSVLELVAGGTELLLRAGVGWQPGVVGRATVPATLDSQGGFALASAQPVVVDDLRTESRFRSARLLGEYGIVSGVSVIIGRREHPFGVLGVHTTTPHAFTDDDVHFVSSVANILFEAIELGSSQAALRESERNFRQLADNIDEAFFIADLHDQRVVYVSPGYETIWGRSRESLHERSDAWLDGIHPEDRPRIEAALADAQSGDFDHEFRVVRPDGAVRWVWDRVFPVRDETGQTHRVAGIAQDITERKAAAEREHRLAAERTRRVAAEARVDARDEVLAVVSHDLRTPLGNIRMASELLEEHVGDGEAADALAVIRRAGEHMERLVQDLLDVARIEAGSLSVRPERLELRTLLTDVCRGLRSPAASRGVLIELDVSDDLPAVHADRDRVAQVLINLLGNALKFGDESGRIAVKAVRAADEVLVEVSNTGPPIAPEHLPQLFERFWQARGGDHRGAGLGLAIVKGVIEAHGGRITVASDSEHGTTFGFTLPTDERAACGVSVSRAS